MRTVSDSRAGRRILFAGVRGREFRHGAGESGGRVGEQPAGLVHGVGGLVFASVGVRDPCLGLRVDSRGLLLGCFEDPVGFGVGVGQEFLRLFAAFADSPVGFLVDPLFAPRGLFDLFVRFFLGSVKPTLTYERGALIREEVQTFSLWPLLLNGYRYSKARGVHVQHQCSGCGS